MNLVTHAGSAPMARRLPKVEDRIEPLLANSLFVEPVPAQPAERSTAVAEGVVSVAEVVGAHLAVGLAESAIGLDRATMISCPVP